MATNSVKDDVVRVRVSKDNKEKLKSIADKNNITISEIINRAIQEEIKNYEFKEKHYKNICDRVVATEEKLQKIKLRLDNRKEESNKSIFKKIFKKQ